MMAFENVMFSQPVAKGGDLNCFGVICLMYSNTVYLQCSNLKDYQWVRCTHNTLAQGSSKDCTTFGLERFRALSQTPKKDVQTIILLAWQNLNTDIF